MMQHCSSANELDTMITTVLIVYLTKQSAHTTKYKHGNLEGWNPDSTNKLQNSANPSNGRWASSVLLKPAISARKKNRVVGVPYLGRSRPPRLEAERCPRGGGGMWEPSPRARELWSWRGEEGGGGHGRGVEEAPRARARRGSLPRLQCPVQLLDLSPALASVRAPPRRDDAG